jgi:hypothetical protein
MTGGRLDASILRQLLIALAMITRHAVAAAGSVAIARAWQVAAKREELIGANL